MKLLFFGKGIPGILLLLILGGVTSVSGQVNTLSYAEKIYLQTDAEVYTAGSQIWFKAVVLAGPLHRPSNLSGVLHIDLISPSEEIVVSQLIRLNQGIGSGTINLENSLAQGTYLLRAYTQWNQNFDTDFIFEKRLPVFTADAQAVSKVDAPGITQTDAAGSRNLRVLLDPLAVDSLHLGKLAVRLALDGKQDTLTVRKKEGDFYVLDYPLTADSDVLSINYQTDTGKEHFQTLVLDTTGIDVQFFPEGGDFIAGIPSQVGFKALGYDGLGRKVSGSIVDENGKELVRFKSNVLGMGSFRLPSLSDTLSYYARIDRGQASALKIALPRVKDKGTTLVLRDLGTSLQVNVLSTALKNDTVVIQLSSRGHLLYKLQEPMQEGILPVIFPKTKLPFGIVAVSLHDKQGATMSRRLYFNENQQEMLKLDVDLPKKEYTPREAVRVKLEVKDARSRPQLANASILVTDASQLGETVNYRENILSYFLIQSELRGNIEKPGFYVQNDSLHTEALDDLLLTQGWVSYKYDTITTIRKFQPEPVLLLEGTVSAPLNKNKRREGVKLALMSFDEELFIQEQVSDSLGRFRFTIDALSGGYQNLLIQTSTENGTNKDYTLFLTPHKKPDVNLRQEAQLALTDTTAVLAARQKTQQQAVLREAMPFGDEDIALDEVLVNSYKMTPKRQVVADEYGMPDRVIDGKAIQAKEKKWSYGLYSVLLFNFPDKIRIVRKGGMLKAEVSLSDTTLVLVDGQPVLGYNYDLIPNLPVSEIESFEIIEMAKNFSSLYLEAYPNASPLEAPPWGHVIAIYTYGGNGLFAAERPKGIIKQRVQVFTEPEAFYTPKYETRQDLNRSEPDLRSTLYWDPELPIGDTGKAEVSFYNPDNTGTMLMLIEAVSANGDLGYKMLQYEIKKPGESDYK
ncbi:hypothetical protein [Leeuwenhoekiella parthenopeia]|uniref:MG2 domain-containing protein n=1 Tax=Leeuwenhoekiella parthenopeia TaxID=2890320 RepID=A0ABS8GXI7_9FLAO|nr:hypothetical protein [Leeuwenhoekiella parthenopeia]MCC4214725.1 hypothetical protein [Leeuwenhoekiella parthenopeia]